MDDESALTHIAPGRVNLIGEHTDYSLMAVLPMAIDRALRVRAVPVSQPGLHVDSRLFGSPTSLRTGDDVSNHSGWHRYAQAALNVVGGPPEGAAVFVDGDLPANGGLSSSSALTVGLVAVLRDLQGEPSDADGIVAAAVAAERLTGVAGGEMDQNAIVRGRAGYALRIDFRPFATRSVAVPDDVAFVVADSGQVAAKGEGAREHYNDRVAGCHEAAQLLARALDIVVGDPPFLADVADSDDIDEAVERLPEMVGVEPGRRSWAELAGGRMVPVRACARHVIGEGRRVDQAEAALVEGDRRALGRLFDESHASLRRFGASTEALDSLVIAMRQAGADGARLTGAGFGGFAIAVCSPDRVDAVASAGVDAGGGRAFEVRPSQGLR